MSVKSPREIAHNLDLDLCDHGAGHWKHGPRCNAVADAIAKDRADLRRELYYMVGHAGESGCSVAAIVSMLETLAERSAR